MSQSARAIPGCAYLYQRGERYVVRVQIPQELRAALGKSEFKKSLGGDLAIAKRRYRSFVSQFLGEIDSARRASVQPGAQLRLSGIQPTNDNTAAALAQEQLQPGQQAGAAPLAAGWYSPVVLLVLRYAAFACIATLSNLAVQRITLSFGDTGLFFIAALGAGTCTGLVVKYLLDKHWIFYDGRSDLAGETRKFSLYTLMGVFTTAIFWGTETMFWLVWGTQTMRETGALIGLAIGYFVKYWLDRRFVFSKG